MIRSIVSLIMRSRPIPRGWILVMYPVPTSILMWRDTATGLGRHRANRRLRFRLLLWSVD